MEGFRNSGVYQWLLRRNGFNVSDTSYFVYCNGRADREAFDGKVEFDVVLLPYTGDDAWVEGVLFEIKRCLDNPVIPETSDDCEFCGYTTARLMYVKRETVSGGVG